MMFECHWLRQCEQGGEHIPPLKNNYFFQLVTLYQNNSDTTTSPHTGKASGTRCKMIVVVNKLFSSLFSLGTISMLFWSGKGWVVPVATFIISLIAELVSENATGNKEYYQTHGLALALALWISAAINAIITWQYYSHLLTPSPPRKKKRKKLQKKSRPSTRHSAGWMDHSFMFINQGVWVVFLLIAGLYVLVSRGI